MTWETTTTAERPRWAWPLTLLPSVGGLGTSIYLTYVHYAEPTGLSCPDTGVINCTKVTTSPESMLFGVIPVAATGIAFFAVMLLLTLPASWSSPNPLLDRLRILGAVGGIGMVLYLVYVEVVQVKAICLWCTVVHLLAFVLFVGVIAATLLRPQPADYDD